MKTYTIFTYHVSREGKAIGTLASNQTDRWTASISPSACFHSIFLSFDLNVPVCGGGRSWHSSPGIENQCHRSRSKVNVKRVWAW